MMYKMYKFYIIIGFSTPYCVKSVQKEDRMHTFFCNQEAFKIIQNRGNELDSLGT